MVGYIFGEQVDGQTLSYNCTFHWNRGKTQDGSVDTLLEKPEMIARGLGLC